MRPSPERFGVDGRTSQPIVGLVVDRMDWHARQVAVALAAHGFGAAPIRLHLCGFATRSASGMQIDGFGENFRLRLSFARCQGEHLKPSRCASAYSTPCESAA